MKINVIKKDLGYFTQEPITVQRIEKLDDEDTEVVFCTHAGAVEEEKETWPTNYDDRTYIVTTLVCDRCGAYKVGDENIWNNAPERGKHED